MAESPSEMGEFDDAIGDLRRAGVDLERVGAQLPARTRSRGICTVFSWLQMRDRSDHVTPIDARSSARTS
jgi:hypothetical protein